MYRRLFYLMMVFVLVSSACSFSLGTTPQPTATQPPKVVLPVQATPTEKPTEKPKEVEPPAATKTPEGAPGAVTTLDDVKNAVVQIVVEGSFIDPQVGVSLNTAKAGTGFIIDPSGIAITNNHVVTGAAMIDVYVAGSKDPKHARVLGVSECSDLAVLKIDGDGYSYLTFAKEAPKVGEDVYLAGFPLGDPEYTLTKGIVSKAKSSGASTWASVENVIEHDAQAKPGNSGSPLVNKDAQVVGIHFAGTAAGNGPYWAISPLEVANVITELKGGKDVTSLGLNGVAVITEDRSLSGIWVRSVKSGSPADKAGIQAGDIITQLEDIVLSTDGTMLDYCNILRSHQPTDTLKVTVLRWLDQKILTGQINGRKLEVVQDYSIPSATETPVVSGGNGKDYSGYVTAQDNSGAFSTEIPQEWKDINGSEWDVTWTTQSGTAQIHAPALSASADLDKFNNTWDESGVFMTASSDLGSTGGYIELLDSWRDYRDYPKYCKLDNTEDFKNSKYEGKTQLWKSCGSNGSLVMVLVARPVSNPTAFLVLIEVVITKEADINALYHIIGMFDVHGSV